jgi:hypothetical protein
MWIFTNNAFISIVQHREQLDHFMIRARVSGDLKKFFGTDITETEMIDADYRFRTVLPKTRVLNAIAKNVGEINYTNFKKSIDEFDIERNYRYMNVWHAMHAWQVENNPADYHWWLSYNQSLDSVYPVIEEPEPESSGPSMQVTENWTVVGYRGNREYRITNIETEGDAMDEATLMASFGYENISFYLP